MRIKGRALSKNQRNDNSWKVCGANRKRQGEFDAAVDRTRPQKKKSKPKKGFRTWVNKYGQQVVKFYAKRKWRGELAYASTDMLFFPLFGGMFDAEKCLEHYAKLPAKITTEAERDFAELMETAL